MFQKVYACLSHQFPIDSAFEFDDFTTTELDQILSLELQHQGLEVTPEARKVVLEMLERARNRPNFGNAGEIDILLNTAKMRHQKRLLSLKKRANLRSASKFEPKDFDEDWGGGERADTNVAMLFEGVIGCEDIVAKLEGFRQTVKTLKQLDEDPRGQVPFNFLFRGPRQGLL